jgi:hypothetical protein
VTRRAEAEKGEKIDPVLKEQVRQMMLKPKGYQIEISKESTFMALVASDKLTDIFNQMKWSLALPEHGYFITSDNPLARRVDAKTYHPIYGDNCFVNKTAEVSLPLSPRLLLLLSWSDTAKPVGVLPREHVETVNVIRAQNSDRYLFAHINDKRVARLAAKYKNSRPTATTQGFGPGVFAPVKVGRRWRSNKNPGR